MLDSCYTLIFCDRKVRKHAVMADKGSIAISVLIDEPFAGIEINTNVKASELRHSRILTVLWYLHDQYLRILIAL
jgi:hypothetical protein